MKTKLLSILFNNLLMLCFSESSTKILSALSDCFRCSFQIIVIIARSTCRSTRFTLIMIICFGGKVCVPADATATTDMGCAATAIGTADTCRSPQDESVTAHETNFHL